MTDPTVTDPGDGATAPAAASSADAGTESPPAGAAPVARAAVILVVDDDSLLGRMVEACLDFEGADVRTAHTLAEARDAIGPDLDHLVLDRRLPDGDGLELLPDLAERCPDVPVVVFTAYDEGGLPEGMVSVPKSDLASLVDLLGLERTDQTSPTT